MFSAIIKELETAGYKLTGKRKTIVEILLAENKHWTAKEILVQLRRKFPKISFDTVYRNLNLLKRMGLVHDITVGGENCCRYKLCYSQHHHHHLVCLSCGQTIEIPICPMDQFNELKEDYKFKITSHQFEVYGYCEACIPS